MYEYNIVHWRKSTNEGEEKAGADLMRLSDNL
jgi:hypothetical protein